MKEQLIKILSSKKMVLSTYLIKVALEAKLSLNEFLVLVYFDNSFNSTLDIELIGNTLGLKPVIQLTDGELVKDNMARNVRNAFYAIIDEFIASHNYNDYDFTIIEFGGKEVTVNHIESYLVEKVTENNVLKGLIPINVCAHCGPGTIGLVITKKINNKSLKDFI